MLEIHKVINGFLCRFLSAIGHDDNFAQSDEDFEILKIFFKDLFERKGKLMINQEITRTQC